MDYKKSTIKVFEYVNKVKDMKRKKKPSSVPVQKIRLDEQTRNDFELEHDTKLKDPYIYLDPDDSFRNRSFLLAYVLSNQIHIKKSKYNPGSPLMIMFFFVSIEYIIFCKDSFAILSSLKFIFN